MKDQAKLFIWEGGAVFWGRLADTALHKHHAVQVCVGVDGPFKLMLDGQWMQTRYAAIPANYPHQLDGRQNLIALVLLDTASSIGMGLDAVLTCDDLRQLSQGLHLPDSIENARDMAIGFARFVDGHFQTDNCDSHKTIADNGPLDGRIEKALVQLERIGDEQVLASDLAKTVGLSQSRFLHLFSQNVGLPFRRYVLWRRIITAMEEVRAGGDLTSAAHAGGFADSAHFSRTFRETFGLSPSKLFKNSQFIQVIT